MKYFTCVMLLSVAVASCATATGGRKQSKEAPAVAQQVEQTKETTKETTHTSFKEKIVKFVTHQPKPKGKMPVCDKSSMPGYADGDALTAAVNGFNARGDDIDECNRRIQAWFKKNNMVPE